MMRRGVGLALCSLVLTAVGCSKTDQNSAQETQLEPQQQSAGQDPSCYQIAKVDAQPPKPARSIFVLIDQTTGLDGALRQRLVSNVQSLLQPGTDFHIYTFSTYSAGHYATADGAGFLEQGIPEDQSLGISVRGLERLNQCLASERQVLIKRAADALTTATSASSSSFANSELMAEMKQLSEPVRASPASDKLVVVVSDLLEHSPVTSFYQNRQLRQLDPSVEVEKAAAIDLFGDFGGARVAVLGAGLLPPDSASNAVRDTRALAELHQFWVTWFARSHATVIEYGEPDLVQPLSWATVSSSQKPTG